MRYTPNVVDYPLDKPRVFVPFEDRKRDLSDLLEFGTVIQIFPGHLAWQLNSSTTEEFITAVRGFFQAHDFTNDDYVVAIGDPVVISIMTYLAARQNSGRVRLLKWDRLPCEMCLKFRCECASPQVRGRYLEVAVKLPWTP